jgi:excisionase family DNA binding protein
MEKKNKSKESAPEFLTSNEVAEKLRISRKALYARIRRGQIEGVGRLGGGRSFRFDKDKVLSSIK